MESPGRVAEWSETYTQYRPQVLAFLRRRLWSRGELAEDLTQETFARAMKADTVMRDPSRIKSYLFRTANNVLISHIRRGNRVTSESELGPEAALDAHVDEAAIDPLSASEASQLRETVDELVGRLPEGQRVAFEEGVLGRRPYAEIAQEHGWTVPKVKASVFRARKTLMAALEDYR